MALQTKKRIRIDYCRVLSKPLNEKDIQKTSLEAFDLQDWFALFKNEYADLRKRIIPHLGDNIRLEHLMYNKFYKLWELSFIRLRSNNLPKWAYSNKESEDMTLPDDEYIGEDVCVIYDPENSIVCIQRNHNSISLNGISVYINKTWNYRDGNVIELDPIVNHIDITKKRTLQTRKLHVRFSTAQQSLDSCGSLQQTLETCKNMGGNTVDITISVGRSKNDKLDKDAVLNVVQTMKTNPGCESLTLSYKENEESPVEYIDLLNCTVYDYITVDIIPKKTIPYSAIIHEMIEKYINKKGLL